MASYPNSVKSFASRSPGQVIGSAHINDLQDEVNAVESALVNGPINLQASTVASLSVTGGSTLNALTSSNSTLANLSVTGGSTIAGALTAGNSTLANLSVAGGSTLSGLNVTSTATFASSVNMAGSATISSVATVGGFRGGRWNSTQSVTNSTRLIVPDATFFISHANVGANSTIHGISLASGNVDGHVLFFFNANASTVVLSNQSAESASTGKFVSTASLAFSQQQGCLMIYDLASAAWRIIFRA